ncbi:MAG TPA: hypothetical protein DCW46_07175 [Desulfotomaculum sp.]|nr:hypothetical protein [Desulfotomaculum sp.]
MNRPMVQFQYFPNKYPYPNCRYAQEIKPENQIWFKSEEDVLAAGYEPCGICKP